MRLIRIRIRNPAQEMRLRGWRTHARLIGPYFIVPTLCRNCMKVDSCWSVLGISRILSSSFVPIIVLAHAQGPVNSDVRKQIRLVRYQSEKISASYQVQGFGEKWLRNYLPTFLFLWICLLYIRRGTGTSSRFWIVRICLFLFWFRDRNYVPC